MKQAAPKAKGAKHQSVKDLVALSDLTRTLPTVQLADAIWQVVFRDIESRGEGNAVVYLQSNFFECGTVEVTQRFSRGLEKCAWDSKKVWQPSFWIGIFGTFPGTGSGAEGLEARHSSWQKEIQARSKTSLCDVFQAMQELYERWSSIFDWGKAMKMTTLPGTLNDHLLKSGTMQTQGRSPAVDYWKSRSEGNYFNIRR